MSLLDDLREVKHGYDTEYVCYFNDGSIRKDGKRSSERIKEASKRDEFDSIARYLKDATDHFSDKYQFDNVKMELLLGLIYDSKDIEDEKRSEDAEPVNGIVRYYTYHTNCYLDGKQSNKYDYYEIMGHQNFIKYDSLVKAIKKSGLDYDIPETFEEFKEQILVGEPFEISVSANFKEKEESNSKQNIFRRK